jgi:hypothetical protein
MTFRRRAVLLSLLALSACGAPAAPVFEPLDYAYLTKIKLDTGRIEIDDTWAPRGQARHVEYLAPTRPQVAMHRMGEERLVAGGTSGHAVFGIDDASIILFAGRLEGHFAVHLTLYDANDKETGRIQAQVTAMRPAQNEDDQDALRTDLDALTRKMMDNLNVEFEYQVRSKLKFALQVTSPDAPMPPPVQQEDLNAKPAADQPADATAPAPAPAAGAPIPLLVKPAQP